MIKSNPTPARWAPSNERKTPKKFSHSYEGSEPRIRLPTPGIQQMD